MAAGKSGPPRRRLERGSGRGSKGGKAMSEFGTHHLGSVCSASGRWKAICAKLPDHVLGLHHELIVRRLQVEDIEMLQAMGMVTLEVMLGTPSKVASLLGQGDLQHIDLAYCFTGRYRHRCENEGATTLAQRDGRLQTADELLCALSCETYADFLGTDAHR
nr:hypothetical protein CFP56_32506 [Quercus suber]